MDLDAVKTSNTKSTKFPVLNIESNMKWDIHTKYLDGKLACDRLDLNF